MLRATPQERQALGVTALLLVAGAGVRIFSTAEGPVEVAGAQADTVGAVRDRAAAELEREQIRSRPLAEGEKIDLNRADALEIDRLPRVGPALAERIVAWRAARGPFRSLADLDSVPGIGAGLLRELAAFVTLPAAPPESAQPLLGTPAGASATRQPLLGTPPAGARLDLNSASLDQLQSLPGIGPALAARIVAARPFRSVEELDSVSGIGPALMGRLRPLVTVR